MSLLAIGLPFCLVSSFAVCSNFYGHIIAALLSLYLLGTKFLCYVSLIFVACLGFINIWKDLFVCYLWISKLKSSQSISMFT